MPVPTDPSNFAVANATGTTITFTWTPGTGQTAFVLKQYDGAHNHLFQTLTIDQTITPELTGTFGGLLPGHLYAFELQATNDSGGSSFLQLTAATEAAKVSWYYATQQDVEDAMSAAGLQIASNMENTDSTTNSDRIGRAGLVADDMMNTRLAGMGFTTPLDLTKTTGVYILKQISVAFVIVQLCRWRMLQVTDMQGGSTTVMDKFANNWNAMAEQYLDRIGNGNILLTASRSIAAPLSNECAVDTTGAPIYPHRLPGFGGLPWGVLP